MFVLDVAMPGFTSVVENPIRWVAYEGLAKWIEGRIWIVYVWVIPDGLEFSERSFVVKGNLEVKVARPWSLAASIFPQYMPGEHSL